MSEITKWHREEVLRKQINGNNVYLRNRGLIKTEWICRVVHRGHKHRHKIGVSINRNKFTAYREALHNCTK